MLFFAIGDCFGNPIGGNPSTPSYPAYFGSIQDVSVDVDQKLVELRSQNKFPDDVAPGDMTIKGKCSFAKLEIDIFNSLFYAETITSGITVTASRVKGTVPGTGPYTVTPTVPSPGVYVEDLGVLYQSNGQPFIRVAAGPTLGQYSTSAGVYTFAAADAGALALFAFTYTLTTGRTLTVQSHLLGYGPTFEMWLQEPYQGNNGLHLYSCRASKFGLPHKRDGYVITDFEFEAYANGSGDVMDVFQATA